MSLALTLLRFEIEDKCEKPTDLEYQAPHISFPHGTSTKAALSYAEVAAASIKPTSNARGLRTPNVITLETFKTKVNTLDETMAARFADLDLESETRVTTLSAVLKKKGAEGEEGSPGSATEVTEEGEDGNSTRPGSAKRGKSFSPFGESSTFHFFSGNPTVEKTEGIIHLYKRDELTAKGEDPPQTEMLCMFGIPTNLSSQDLLQFVEPVQAWIERMNIIRDEKPNNYMMLLKFRNMKYLDEFYKHFNGKPFNTIEPDICHLIYVGKVESIKASEGGGLPMPGVTELPVCPVCLERMDESVSSILTILCNHSFHGACLAQWEDSTCPVCRYIQTPEGEPDNHCNECRASESLWICLICGHVGCGRYVGGHAYTHFENTNHTYSMQLGNNQVWDYAGDNYVHRLVQSKGDGKLVEVDEGGNVMRSDDKVDSINLEYTYLLTSQLDGQRRYFEEKLDNVEKQCSDRLEEWELSKQKSRVAYEAQEKIALEAIKEKQQAEKKYHQVQSKLTKTQNQLGEEKEMNRFLRDNQAQWLTRVEKLEKKLEEKDKEVAELQDQLRDIMFYVDAQQKLANTTEASQAEIRDSEVVVSPSATGGRKARKKQR